jgi:hypothetical protein
MAKSRVNGGQKTHRRLVHKRAQIQHLGRNLRAVRSYTEEVSHVANDFVDHHDTVHADCAWPKAEPQPEPPAAA